jgi:hypothetical protein
MAYYRRRRRYYNRRKPSKSFQRKVKKAMVNMATKYIDLTTGSGGPIDAIAIDDLDTSTITGVNLLNQIAEGDTEHERDGQVIFNKNLHLTMEFTSSASSAEQLRLIIFKYDADSDPQLQNIFTNSSCENGTNHLWYLAQYTRKADGAFGNNYKMYLDKKFTLSSGVSSKLLTDIMIDLKDMKTTYSGTTGTSIEGGRLYVAVFSDLASSGSPATYYWSGRLKYCDNI